MTSQQLILDCGATKTDWRYISSEGIKQGKLGGFNPNTHSLSEFSGQLEQNVYGQFNNIDKIHFYGAGIISYEHKESLHALFTHLFPHSQLFIETDLMGVARSLCLDLPGFACILGTGSNSCFYDGSQIISNIPSLGYVLGDEGSGAALGSMLIRNYLRNLFPVELKQSFENRFSISLEDVLKRIYHEPKGNVFLASFAKYASDHLDHPTIYDWTYQVLNQFFEKILIHYDQIYDFKVNFSGSIGFYFANMLRQIGHDRNIAIGTIVESPIAGLTLYHQKNS